jgi:hypothetical protein
MKKILTASLLLMNHLAFAQTRDGSIQMADRLRQDGKIYVVVAVVLTILAGILFYLVRLDRKITKLEKSNS